MAKLTNRAAAENRRARLQRWVSRNIIADDPRSQEEQRADEDSRDRSPVWFAIVVLFILHVYFGVALALIF